MKNPPVPSHSLCNLHNYARTVTAQKYVFQLPEKGGKSGKFDYKHNPKLSLTL